MGISLTRLAEIDLTQGILQDVPVVFLVGMAKMWNVTGVLTLERNKIHKQIFFMQGMPVYCKSDLPGESLRQVMLKAGKIDQRMLAKVQECMENGGVEEDRALLELGVLDDSTRYFHLQEQARKRILSSFTWAGGYYSFEANEEFLERIELFDIDPLDVIYEGITTHHTMDVANVVQEVASQTVEAAENMEDFELFIERIFPESNPDWDEIEGKPLGNILPKLHPDIKKAIDLAFILISSGGLFLGGRIPGELNPPPSIEDMEKEPLELTEQVVEEATGEATEEATGEATEEAVEEKLTDDAVSDDIWNGEVDSPHLEDEDFDLSDMNVEPSAQATSEVAEPAARPAPRKKPGPPPAPPAWLEKKRSKRQKKLEIISPRLRPKSPRKSPAGAHQKSPHGAGAQAGASDPDIEKRFLKMIEVLRRGNPFEILDVDEDTPRAEINKAYFYRNSQFHPDKKRALGSDGERLVNEVQDGLRNAYDTLLDPARRQEYQLHAYEDERKKAWSIELRVELARKQFKRGLRYMSQRHPELALPFFDTAANLDTEQAPYYAFLGWSQYASRHGEAAACMAFIRTALGINSRLSEAHLFLGWIKKDIGDGDEAVKCFERALEHNPQNSFARQELEKIGTPKKKPDGDGLMKRLFKK